MQKLIESLEELVKPFKQTSDNKERKDESIPIESKESYLRAKNDSIEFYEREMIKIFVGKGFLEDDKFEEHNKRSRSTAWGKFKSRRIAGGDDVFFKQCQDELYEHLNTCYSKYRNINKDSRKNPQTEIKALPNDTNVKPTTKIAPKTGRKPNNRKMESSQIKALPNDTNARPTAKIAQKTGRNPNNKRPEPSEIKSKESYLKAKHDSIDSYDREMNKMFIGMAYLEDDEFEKQHSKCRNKAWAQFKAKEIEKGDTAFFKQCEDELYNHLKSGHLRYKQTNMDNRQSAERSDEVVVIKAMNDAKENYSLGMENYLKGSTFVDENSLKKMHDFFESSELCKVFFMIIFC